MTLRWQIALAVAAIVAAVSAAAAVGAYVSTERQLAATADDTLTATAREVGNGPDGDTDGGPLDGDLPGAGEGCPPAGLLEPAAAAQIVHPDGTITSCVSDGVTLPPVASRPTGSTVTLDTVSADGTTLRVATVEFHGGGWLQVARDGEEAETVLHALPDDAAVEVRVAPTSVEVCDRGEGIDPGDLDHVFERFYRADLARTRPGSGLGLAIVAQIVERHGGRVWARNRVGGGAAVGFTLDG